ncbi:MAG: hypothetical protein SOZ49_06845 [Clostridiaceae bacterium]|nr:hypothetical protein [Clostridia bacterium]MDD7311021.1 hypothetical protein [Clostridia bacterium]MDY3870936.1 hypothetical protein [Clostridiaceae bacterium]
MKVIDTIQKIEKDLSYDELVDLMANHNRQVDLILTGKKSDEDGHVWDAENWTCVDGKRFIRSYFCEGRASSDYSGYNKYDMKGCFLPEEAKEVRLG